MAAYARVIIDIVQEKLDRVFDYRIPESLAGAVRPGLVVRVPFGRGNRDTRAYVVEVTDRCDLPAGQLKDIFGPEEGRVPVESRLIELASWMKNEYGGTMAQALKTVLSARRVIRPVKDREIVLTAAREEAKESLALCEKKGRKAMARLLAALLTEPELPYSFLGKLGVSAASVRSLSEKGLIEVREKTVYRNPVRLGQKEDAGLCLTDEQGRAYAGILSEMEEGAGRPCLLFGVTGSGKTEVYLKLIERMVSQGKQCIVLIPEIALTYQILLRFYRRFGDRVSIMNSRLSQGEKYDQYLRAKRGEIDVIIGPRSALFTPFPNLGLIIIDEEHETSYISETVPCYHSRETAIHLAETVGAGVVLGSATPSVDSMKKARDGEYLLLEMRSRAAAGSRLPAVDIVDLREEMKAGNKSIFSRELAAGIEDALEKGEQVMLFINRRGYANFVSCRSCGKAMKCPHCDVSLTLHRNGSLRCHYCGYAAPMPDKCPECGSPYIAAFGIGTQKVEAALHSAFPKARVLRMDLDTTSGKEGHEKILSRFRDGSADILLGTQMIVKGHDFPGVTLVGVLAADLSLHSSDFRAAERTCQLLTQAAGRAGRGEMPGRVIIQTYDPEHYAVRAAAGQDYEAFYENEILYREMLHYPPVYEMAEVLFRGTDADKTMAFARDLAAGLGQFTDNGLEMIGPSEAPLSRINDYYRVILYLRAPAPADLDGLIRHLEAYSEENAGEVILQISRK